MNPFPIVMASLRRHWIMNILFVLLIAVAVAIGVGITAQERALRQGSAQAADKFDILIAAPGSHTEIVMNTIFLQHSAVNLLDGQYWASLIDDPRVEIAAPLAFGDSWQDHSIIGSTPQFVDYLSDGLATGHVFENIEQAVIGAAVPLEIGDEFEPVHGQGAEAELEHHHHGVHLEVVGKMNPTGTLWDSAIIVAVEQVWDIHALPTGHDEDEDDHDHDGAAEHHDEHEDHDHDETAEHHDEEHEHDHEVMDHIGPPFDADALPGVPALVVRPKSVAAAYTLRSDFRTEHSTAFFPAEVLVEMYRLLGNAGSVMRAMALGSQGLVVAAILAAILALMQLYRKQFAVLRALGAPRSYVFGAIWSYVSILVVIGAIGGLGLGWFVAQSVSAIFTAETGMALQATISRSELSLAGGFILIGLILATVPAFLLYRRPVVEALRNS
ncbi:FtsX-like permease family protein [Thalassospira alkalitolerans]|uniref:FtsX-like permease family protein n=1 Tax=Thalassospira alkalitolerans TaxID=1293890 RepID=UPI0030EEE8AE|tara:strand:+ start:40385 stop:41707 length:1323 start_codon:yes stop_codon:yes gene_type:complete